MKALDTKSFSGQNRIRDYNQRKSTPKRELNRMIFDGSPSQSRMVYYKRTNKAKMGKVSNGD